jgi:hypothetical protein
MNDEDEARAEAGILLYGAMEKLRGQIGSKTEVL